ncbi:MAG TPA: hypothetical protein VI198_06600, partial [Candidatus Eisenbacteria bacterium]
STTSFSPATPLPGSAAHPAAAKQRRGSPLPWAIAAIALLTTVAVTAWLYPRATAPRPVYRFQPNVDVPGGLQSYWPRLSPDGNYLAFIVVDSASVSRAWIRRMDEIKPRVIQGAEGFGRFYWSPDSREVAFIANGRMLRVPIAGGSPVVICDARGGADLSWGSKGLILMDGTRGDSLRVVPAGGGELRPATRIERSQGESGHAWPYFLPDGEHFLYMATMSNSSRSRIRLGKIGSLDSKLLGESDGRVEYVPGGWILFLRETTLMAQKLDLNAGKLTGQPIPIAEGVRVGGALGHFSVSNTGLVSYAQLAIEPAYTIRFANRSGILTGTPISTGNFRNPQLSPEGRRLLVERRDIAGRPTGAISVLDIERGTETRLTFTGGLATTPQWSPDGRQFAWVTFGGLSPAAIHVGSSDGLGAQDSIPLQAGQAFLSQWDAAGSRWMYYEAGGGRVNVRSIATAGSDRTPKAYLDPSTPSAGGMVSPDGKWLAFSSGRGSGIQVYVQSLLGPPGRWQISTTGGYWPRWTKGGSELVFEAADGRLMAVDIDTKSGFQAGTPRVLFTIPARLTAVGTISWTADASGEKFVLIVPPRVETSGAIEVVTDFGLLVNRK